MVDNSRKAFRPFGRTRKLHTDGNSQLDCTPFGRKKFNPGLFPVTGSDFEKDHMSNQPTDSSVKSNLLSGSGLNSKDDPVSFSGLDSAHLFSPLSPFLCSFHPSDRYRRDETGLECGRYLGTVFAQMGESIPMTPERDDKLGSNLKSGSIAKKDNAVLNSVSCGKNDICSDKKFGSFDKNDNHCMFTMLSNFLEKQPWQFSTSFPRFVKMLEKLKIDLHLTLRHNLISELINPKNPFKYKN